MNKIKIYKHYLFGNIIVFRFKDGDYFLAKDIAEALMYEDLTWAINECISAENKIEKTVKLVEPKRKILINEDGVRELIHNCIEHSLSVYFLDWLDDYILPDLQGEFDKPVETSAEVIDDLDMEDNVEDNMEIGMGYNSTNEIVPAGSNELKIFKHEQFGQIRIIKIDGEPYFAASDVAKALGYSNPNKAVNDHCRAITKRSTPISGKMQDINFIPEDDVYRLTYKCKASYSDDFRDWIMHDVLVKYEESKNARIVENTNIITIDGIECYEENGTAYLKLETVARGLGFTEISKSGNETIRWRTVKRHLEDLGIATSCDGLPDFIPENIFYRLAMKAKNEAAEAFQAKVADEIIPAIRKHGAYMTPATIKEVLLNPDTIIQIATALKEEQEKNKELVKIVNVQNETIGKQEQYIEKTKPQLRYYKHILQSKELMTISIIADDYGVNASQLNLYLNYKKVIKKIGSKWHIRSKYINEKFTGPWTNNYVNGLGIRCTNTYMRWTQKGRKFICDLLATDGIYPLMDMGDSKENKSRIKEILKEAEKMKESEKE